MATTYNDQNVALNALTDSIVYPNGVRAITGATLNTNEIGQNDSAFSNLVAYDNYTYKVVRTYGTNSANGQSLRDAYNDAKTLTPGGLPLSITNRVALLIPPGTYALGTSGLEVDTQFIDFIGLGRADETIITSLSNTGTGLGTITQTTNDVKFRNITLQNDANTYVSADSTDDSAYAPQGVYPSVEFTDCIFKNPAGFLGAPFMRLDTEYSGNFIRCRGIDPDGVSIFFPIASGFYFDCHYAGSGFGAGAEASGIFSDCSCLDGFGFAGAASGSFTRCTAFNSGFGNNGGSASGNFNYCTALTASFGWGTGGCSGTFINCQATDNSFGDSTNTAEFRYCKVGSSGFGCMTTTGVATMAGTYISCQGGDNCFYGIGFAGTSAVLSGTFDKCSAGDNSFGGCPSATLSGSFISCSAGDNSFGRNLAALSGSFDNCVGNEYCFGSPASQANAASITGVLNNCSADGLSFGLNSTGSSAAIISNCTGGDSSFQFTQFGGTIKNCSAGDQSFPISTTSTAVISNCVGGDSCFSSGFGSATLAGSYTNCIAGDDSFLSDATYSGVSELSGSFIGCRAGVRSFGYILGGSTTIEISGTMVDCTAGESSFCGIQPAAVGSHAEEISGYLENCHAGPNSFASASSGSKTGTLVNCSVRPDGVATPLADEGPLSGTMQNCSWLAPEAGEAALIVEDGAKVYGGIYRAGAGATASITSGGAVTASIANVLVNVALGGSITNNISSPNVIVDSDV